MFHRLILNTAALTLLTAGSALADPIIEGATPGPGVPEPARKEQIITTEDTQFPDGSALSKSTVETRSIPPARLMNKVIVDADGLAVATVERLIEDPATGKVRYIVAADEEHRYIVPFSAFTVGERGGDLALSLPGNKARLAASPRFLEDRATSYTRTAEAQPVYAYWGVTWED